MNQLPSQNDIYLMQQNGSTDDLNDAMFEALIDNKVDFVRLLIESGVSMPKFLTINRLEQLYNAERGPPNSLIYIVGDVVNMCSNYRYTLPDIGLAVEKLMGNGFRCYYTRNDFKKDYDKRHSPKVADNTVFENENTDEYDFKYPFNNLLIWAVLTKRHAMALCMWEYGEEAMAKALMACKLYKSLTKEAAEDCLNVALCEDFEKHAEEFQILSLELLDGCYKQNDAETLKLLTYELIYWGRETCLSLAVIGNNKPFLAHPCCQVLLADLWHGGMRLRSNPNLKVILGLLCPLSIVFLDFKSRKELMLQAQTAAEHNDNANEAFSSASENDDIDPFSSTRNANLTIFRRVFPRRKQIRQSPEPDKPTEVQESRALMENARNEIPVKRMFKQRVIPQRIIRRHPLRVRRKIYEFFVAPITTFWSWFLSYLIFLGGFTYVLLIRTPANPTIVEYCLLAYVVTFGIELIRKVAMSEPHHILEKLNQFFGFWNSLTILAVLSFVGGFVCRVTHPDPTYGRCILSVSAVLWTLKMLDFLSVHPKIGPLVTMAGKMILSMTYVIVMLCVSLLAFGLARQAITFPNEKWSWILLRNIFYKPYFMLYGEVYAKNNFQDLCNTTSYTNGIDICGDHIWECHKKTGIPLSEAEKRIVETCVSGHWIPPILTVIFLLINLLLLSMLLAIFDNIFKETDKVSHQIWMFQRYWQVMKYESTPFVPPPFTLIYHGYMVIKYVRHRILIRRESWVELSQSPFDFSLKLFLDADELEKLHDFEEECMEDYIRKRAHDAYRSDQERLRRSAERTSLILRRLNNLVIRKGRIRTNVDTLEGRIEQMDERQDEIVDCLRQVTRVLPTILNRIQPYSNPRFHY